MKANLPFINDVITVLTEIGSGKTDHIFDRISKGMYNEAQIETAKYPSIYKIASLFITTACLLMKLSETTDTQYLESTALRMAEVLERFTDCLYEEVEKVAAFKRANASIGLLRTTMETLFQELSDEDRVQDYSFLDISMLCGAKATLLMGISVIETELLHCDWGLTERTEPDDGV